MKTLNKKIDHKNKADTPPFGNTLLYEGLICPYCGNNSEYIDSSFIYGKSYGMIYI